MVIATGAGRGIGKAIALGLANTCANVVVVAHTACDIESTASEVEAKGKKALCILADVRLSDQVNSLVDRTVERFGRIDVLVNNAGGLFNISTMNMSEGGWDAIIRENLKSVFLRSQGVAKVMVRQEKGAIVNIASAAGLDAYTFNAA